MPKIVNHDARRESIATAACRVIARMGIDSVTLGHVGDEAGCTTGAITHYFADKDAVMLAALELTIERHNARMARAIKRDPADLCGFLAESLPIERESRDGTKVWYSFWTRAFSSPALNRRQRAMHVRWFDKIIERLKIARDAGYLDQNMDIDFEAETIAALVNGIGLRAVLDAKEWPAGRQLSHLDNYLSKILIQPGLEATKTAKQR